MPHSTWAAVADGFPEIMVSPQAAERAAFSWVMVMIFGVGRPRAWCLIGTSWKKASSVPEVNHKRSMPFSFIDAIIASAACSAGIEYVGSIGGGVYDAVGNENGRMDKVVASPAEAVADVPDGASICIS